MPLHIAVVMMDFYIVVRGGHKRPYPQQPPFFEDVVVGR